MHTIPLRTIGKPLEEIIKRPDELLARTEYRERMEYPIISARLEVNPGGGPAGDKFVHSRGKLTANERLEYLCDEGTKFLPLNTFAHYQDEIYGKASPRAAVITGIATVNGRRVIAIANDNTVGSGSWSEYTVKKIIRAQRLARKFNVPIAWLIDTAGLNLATPYLTFSGEDGAGGIFGEQAKFLEGPVKRWQGAAVFGSNIAGGGYIPIASDYKVMVEGAYMAIGAETLMSSTGVKPQSPTDFADVNVHMHTSGCITDRAPDDLTAIKMLRNFLGTTPNQLDSYRHEFKSSKLSNSTFFNPSEIGVLMPDANNKVYDSMQIISRITDNGFLEYKPKKGVEINCGVGYIGGLPVGIVANNQIHSTIEGKKFGGRLYEEGIDKLVDFVSKCTNSGLPMLWLLDVQGFNMGPQAEANALLAKGYELIRQNTTRGIPNISILLRKAAGAGYYAMSGKPTGSYIEIATPYAELMVMPPEASAKAVHFGEIKKLEKSAAELRTLNGYETFVKPLEENLRLEDKMKLILDLNSKLGTEQNVDDKIKQYIGNNLKLYEKISALASKTAEESSIIKMSKRMHADEVVLFKELYDYIRASVEMAYQGGTIPARNFSIWPLHTGR